MIQMINFKIVCVYVCVYQLHLPKSNSRLLLFAAFQYMHLLLLLLFYCWIREQILTGCAPVRLCQTGFMHVTAGVVA